MQIARRHRLPLIGAAIGLGLMEFGGFRPVPLDTPRSPARGVTGRLAADLLASVPMRFEANAGQADPDVCFLARGAGFVLYFTSTESVLRLANDAVLRTRLLEANPDTRVEGGDRLPGHVNYFTGGAARTGIPTYAQVRYRQVYDGVDLVYYGSNGRLEYDFVVRAGASPSSIRLALDGARDVAVEETGDLGIDLGGTAVSWRRPVAYQEVDGVRRPVESRYALHRTGNTFAVGFEVGAYDPARPLVIDPVLAYSTRLGGSDQDSGYAVAVERNGSVYVAGNASSLDFPSTKKAVGTTFAGGRRDVAVTKLNADATRVLYSTYLGGSGDDFVLGLALRGGDGPEVYVTGATESTDFPTTRHAFQGANRGGYDAFVARLVGDGNHLQYSSYLGGSGDENLSLFGGIAVNKEGEAFVTGNTESGDFPTAPAKDTPVFQTNLRGAANAFVTKVRNDGHALVYSTYLGGEGYDTGAGIAVDEADNAYVAGATSSTAFPVTLGGFQVTYQGNGDAFWAKLGPRGTLAHSTYFGGSDADFATGIALNENRQTYLVGSTASGNFPTTAGAFQTATTGPRHGSYDGFVTRFNRAPATLDYSTLLGGSEVDVVQGVAVDALGNAYVAGATQSIDFPRLDAFGPPMAEGDVDAFVAKLSNGSTLVYSSHLGGRTMDEGRSVAVDRYGAAYVVGETSSRDFPVTPGALQSAAGGPSMVFVTKISGSKKPLND